MKKELHIICNYSRKCENDDCCENCRHFELRSDDLFREHYFCREIKRMIDRDATCDYFDPKFKKKKSVNKLNNTCQ